jgi:hypothetical protein
VHKRLHTPSLKIAVYACQNSVILSEWDVYFCSNFDTDVFKPTATIWQMSTFSTSYFAHDAPPIE